MNFDVSTMNCLGSWRPERYWLQSPPLSCYMTGVLKIFLQRPTRALLLHRISHVTHCVNILTKALPLFILLLQIAYVELKVEKWKHALMSHLLQNQTSWSRSCTCVEGGWWNEILLLWVSLSFIWITSGHGYIIVYLFFLPGLMCPIFLGSSFLGMPSFSLSVFL